MQNGNNNMDNKLRQLENQSLPDLSRQDEHWQDLKTMLQPGAAPSISSERNNRRIWAWVVAACSLGILFFLGYKTLFNSNNKKTVQPAIVTTPVTIDTLKKGSTDPLAVVPARDPAVKPLQSKDHGVTFRIKKGKDKKMVLETETAYVDTSTRAIATVDNTPKPTLDDFFKQLEKAEQGFSIDPKRDTVIRGKDGTALLIPANTFAGKEPVTIILKEYYSYEDIVTNKLSTLSNDRQLVTGGMIHLTAIANGKELSMVKGSSIRWFIPDTTSSMKDMQVFNGVKNNGPAWTAGTYSDGDGGNTGLMWANDINWVPQQRNFNNNFLYTSVKVLDLRNDPYRSWGTKKGMIGKFHISADSKISKEEMVKLLKEKYGYYKVKIKEVDDVRLKGYRRSLFGRSYTSRWETTEELGDSAWVDIKIARAYHLAAKDTIVSRYPAPRIGFDFKIRGSRTKKGQGSSALVRSPLDSGITSNNTDPAFSNKNLNDLAKKYSVDIRNLGWINCDQFYNDSRPKIDYYVDLSDTATNYYTLLVFDKIRSMMTGAVNGNKVVFKNVPLGATAKVISVTVKDGKLSSAMEAVTLSRTMLSGLKFEETTPSEFKEQAASMDN